MAEMKKYKEPPCIFSTSKALFKECREAYIPQIVSIGPYHYGKRDLKGMERYKDDAVDRELYRIKFQMDDDNSELRQMASEVTKDDILKELVRKIARMERRIRVCYDKEISFKGEDLSLMMVRDACFILEIFRCFIYENAASDNVLEEGEFQILQMFHPIFGSKSNPVVRADIMKDLIKLENQIPLFVLEQVLAMELRGCLERAKYKLQIMLTPVFEKFYYRPFECFADGSKSQRPFNHILDIYHYLCLGDVAAEKRPDEEDAQLEENNLNVRVKIPDAIELKTAGVKFRAASDGNIKFEGRTLTIVPIQLYSDTEIFIRNLIALENCSPLYSQRVMTAYAQFMEELCQTQKGVDVMRKEGIIYGNLWHHKRVRQLWNSLNSSKLSALQAKCPKINLIRAKLSERNHYTAWTLEWNKFWQTPVLPKTWLVAGGIGGIIILILTAVQVLCLLHSCGAH